VSDDAANAACGGTAFRSQGSRIHATTSSVLGHHRQLAAADGVADSGGLSVLLADSNSPTRSAAPKTRKHYINCCKASCCF